MAEAKPICPMCGRGMEQGFVVDNTTSKRVVNQWATDARRKSVFTGTKWPDGRLVTVGTFRCSGCGYLESYAMPEFAAE